MIAVFTLLIVLFNFSFGQTPPSSFPANWFTWTVTTVIKVGETRPTHSFGQLISYSVDSQWSCRLNQQNLLQPRVNRPVDYCDFESGVHSMLDSTSPDTSCTGTSTLEGTIGIVTYPPEYLKTARFLGVDRVNQKDCNHFVAYRMQIDGKELQMDVWTAIDDSYPCQISITDLDTLILTNWAFDGFGTIFPSDAINQCLAAKIMCTQANWICQPKPGTPLAQLVAALDWVCDPTHLDCSPIEPGGPYYLPNTPEDHAKWAFNAYFRLHRPVQGPAACYFGGIAELVPPPSKINPQLSTSNRTIDLLDVFTLDLTCERQ
jgi:hypothetical protein